ncbi:MAG: DHA2 family efflux MFS transporter permease subunit [Actinobacteria bacterium]|nr:DHA2 family efflux MFS transporter permease subunit [Actinomycetota bacterium]
MTLIDLTIVNVAIPQMVDKLQASLDQVLWVINAYTLVLAVLMITAGRLGDLRGKKMLFLAGIAVFTLASLACGLAQNAGELITFRAIQGGGAALLLPQTMSIIVETFPHRTRGIALGIWGAVAGLSGAVGPTVGGVLVTEADWRWVFFVNVPLGIVVLLAGWPIIPTVRHAVRHRFDTMGVVIASISLFCLVFALTEGQRYSWNGWIWTLLGAAAAFMVMFFLQQRGQQAGEPLLPFVLFRDRNFSVMNFVGITVMFGMMGLFLPMTIYLQSVLGFTALRAGLVLIAMAVGAMATAGPAGVLAEKLGAKYILIAGLLAFGGSMLWLMTVVAPGRSWTSLVAPLFVMGLGVGCTFSPMAAELMRNVPLRLSGAASGVSNALRQVGSVLAGAVIGAVLQTQLASSLATEAARRSAAVPLVFRGRFVSGFAHASSNGLQIGAGQAGTAQRLAGVPAVIARHIEALGAQVFQHGYIDAMKPTLALTAAVLGAGAVLCLVVKAIRGVAADRQDAPQPEAELKAGAGHASPAA